MNFIPYGGPPNNGTEAPPKKRHSVNSAAEAALLGGGAAPELVLGEDGGRGSVSLQLAYDPANLALQVEFGGEQIFRQGRTN